VTTGFRAMGCEVVVDGADGCTLAEIVDLFRSRERTLSRFLPTSELCRVNDTRADAVVVSEVLADAIADAKAAARATGGIVDATIGRALVAAGYDRDLADVRANGGGGDTRLPAQPEAAGHMQDIVLVGRLLRRPPGVILDLNGVVKSRAVDDAAALLGGPGFVSAGGDIAVTAPTSVSLPAGGTVAVGSGGIATSGVLTRAWRRGGGTLHHLIDPRSGLSSTSRWVAVTVAAGSCLGADVAAKAAFLLDGDGPSWLDDRALPGRFLRRDGTIVTNEAWRTSVGACARKAT
jgi:thiamine biosynthesis lipoprotein